MDNFKRTKRHSQRPSVDGFVRPTGSSSAHKPTDGGFKSGASIGPSSFKRSNGFLPSVQPNISSDTKAPLDDLGRKGKRKNKIKGARRSPLKRALRSLLLFFIIAVVAVGGIAGYAYLKQKQVFRGGGSSAALEKNVDPIKLKGEGDGRVNVLLLGIGGEGHDGAYLTDTIVIASIDPVQNEVALLSVPRDFWVKQDGSASKINAVYAFERESVFAKTKDKEAATKAAAAKTGAVLATVLGIKMNYFVVADFTGFEKAIDTVGGVQVNVTEDTAVTELLYDEASRKNYYLDVKPGVQQFDGIRALYYARSRHTSPRGDFDRAARQRQLLFALKDKVISAGTYANPFKVTQLLSTFGDHVRTDLSINEVMRIYDIGKNITSDKTISVGLADAPNILVTTSNIDGQSVVVPKAGTFDYTDIQYFVRNSLKDAYLKNENSTLAVLNGTPTEGLANKKATELKSFGYNVISTGNAPTKTYTKTVVVDLTNGQKKYTKNYLEKRFGVTAVTTLPDATIAPNGADFVIVLGTDSANSPAARQ